MGLNGETGRAISHGKGARELNQFPEQCLQMFFLPKHGTTSQHHTACAYGDTRVGRTPLGGVWGGAGAHGRDPTMGGGGGWGSRSPREGSELSACVPTQVGDGEGRAGHARAPLRASRLPGHWRPLDEAAGFLPEAQTHQQPPRPLRTCKCRGWEKGPDGCSQPSPMACPSPTKVTAMSPIPKALVLMAGCYFLP